MPATFGTDLVLEENGRRPHSLEAAHRAHDVLDVSIAVALALRKDEHLQPAFFYCKRDDPSVLVERPFGIGYTVNFAHPVAWVLALIPLRALVAVAAAIMARHAGR